MKFGYRIVIPVLLILAVVAGCSGGGGGGGFVILPASPAPSTPVVATSVTGSYITAWAQTVPLQSGTTGTETPGVFPGQANKWDLGQDLALNDGGDGQFNYAEAFEVFTAASGSNTFPLDQTYGEIAFYGPLMGAAQGVITAAVSDGQDVIVPKINGTYSAYLNATSDSKLSQSLVLTGATGSLTASWNDTVNLCDGGVFNISGYMPSYQVVVRNAGGGMLATLATVTGTAHVGGATAHSADLTAFAGQTVVLSFEQKSMQETLQDCYTVIDDVSVQDGATREYVANGTFEAGTLASWTANAPSESQNITSGSRSVSGLDVKRSFYAVPNKLWGRWTDLYTNNTPSPITTTIHYQSDLGSSGYGIIYQPANTSGKALSAWDGGFQTRDVGFVFGNAASVDYLSDSGFGNGTGFSTIDVFYTLTIPAGGKAAIVNFVIMDGTDTGSLTTTVDASARATDIDTAAAAIVNNFWSDTQYRDGMTQEQLNAIKNF